MAGVGSIGRIGRIGRPGGARIPEYISVNGGVSQLLVGRDVQILTGRDQQNLHGAPVISAASPVTWTGRKGINLVGNYQIVADGGDPVGYAANVYQAYGAAYTPTVLNNIRNAGFEYARCVVRVEPLLSAMSLGNSTRVATYLSDIKTYFIDPVLGVGLNVIFDVHPSPGHPTWGTPALLAGKSVSDPTFVVLKQTTNAIATALAPYSAFRVAHELLNEPIDESTVSGINAVWNSTLCKSLWDEARSVDPYRTRIVSGTEYGNISALVGVQNGGLGTGLNIGQFDSNTIFSFHYYDPVHMTHCGYQVAAAPPSNYYRYYDGISFPFDVNGVTDTAALNAAIATATANINADSGLSAGTKTSYISDVTSILTNMYINQSTAYHAGQSGKLRSPINWIDRQGLHRSQLVCGEFGVIVGSPGATQAGRDNYFSMIRQLMDGSNVRWSPWNWEENIFGIGKTGTVALSTRQALGLA